MSRFPADVLLNLLTSLLFSCCGYKTRLFVMSDGSDANFYAVDLKINDMSLCRHIMLRFISATVIT